MEKQWEKTAASKDPKHMRFKHALGGFNLQKS